MRTSERILSTVLIGVGLGLATSYAFDGTHAPADLAPAPGLEGGPHVGPLRAFDARPALARPLSNATGEGSPLQEPVILAAPIQNPRVHNPAEVPSGLEAPGQELSGRAPSGQAPLNLPLGPAPLGQVPLTALPLAAAPPDPALTQGPLTSFQAFQWGTRALRAGDTKAALRALEYAAANDYLAATWKLGRMYADGDGVEQSDLRAFGYFRSIADAHADEVPGTPQARFTANALVALGNYYLSGIPESTVRANPDRAREMYAYAASYFGDPDAQYHLGRMYLDGTGGAKDSKQAARWLTLAARKGQYQAQAVLGSMLFKGEYVLRQASRGLMWLTLARDAAPPQEGWIAELHAAALKQATEDERAIALVYLERWLKVGRD